MRTIEIMAGLAAIKRQSLTSIDVGAWLRGEHKTTLVGFIADRGRT